MNIYLILSLPSLMIALFMSYATINYVMFLIRYREIIQGAISNFIFEPIIITVSALTTILYFVLFILVLKKKKIALLFSTLFTLTICGIPVFYIVLMNTLLPEENFAKNCKQLNSKTLTPTTFDEMNKYCIKDNKCKTLNYSDIQDQITQNLTSYGEATADSYYDTGSYDWGHSCHIYIKSNRIKTELTP